jgi:hypothetical protein
LGAATFLAGAFFTTGFLAAALTGFTGFFTKTGFFTAFLAAALGLAVGFAVFLAGTAFLGADLVAFAFMVCLLAAPGRTMVCVEVTSVASSPLTAERSRAATL